LCCLSLGALRLPSTRGSPPPTVLLDYALALPEGFDELQAYPVLVVLPPGGQGRSMVEASLPYFEAEGVRRSLLLPNVMGHLVGDKCLKIKRLDVRECGDARIAVPPVVVCFGIIVEGNNDIPNVSHDVERVE
jgi:hypothetical protein